MPQKLTAVFSIAGVTVALKSVFPLKVTENFQPFCSQVPADYNAEFVEVKELPPFPENVVCREAAFDVAVDETGSFARRFRDEPRNNTVYAVGAYDWENRSVQVQYIADGLPCMNHTNGAFFHIAWEDMLLHERRLILHACCVDASGCGILFSGPSGIGKSTQGDLWCKWEGAKLINGDRPVLCNHAGAWTAFGSPYAGSSKCHVNESVPVSAVVMLRQAKSCQIRRLGAMEAFQKVFPQLTVNFWDKKCVGLACMLAEQLISDLPVYELACTPDQAAVELLKSTLRQEGRI